jgi:hypothetical protein
MSIEVVSFQALIFLSIFLCGYHFRHLTAALWICWTIIAVFTSFLFVIQLGTIALAWHITGIIRREPLSWWWYGPPDWARNAEKLLSDSKKMMSKQFGFIEYVCSHCSGARCEHAFERLGGIWAIEKPMDPASVEFSQTRSDLMKQLEATISAGRAADPDHRWIKKMTSALGYLRANRDLDYAAENFRRYEFAISHASAMHREKVKRFTISDLLTIIFILSTLIFMIQAFLVSNVIREWNILFNVVAGISLGVSPTSLTIRICRGLSWKRRGIRMEQFFALDGGLASLFGSNVRKILKYKSAD